jgi:prepilin-type N-terminal cleavage/methylation domain-containing protein
MHNYSNSKLKRTSSGFSLIELLIVVAIILIIAAIPISSLFRARASEHQKSAVANLRTAPISLAWATQDA